MTKEESWLGIAANLQKLKSTLLNLILSETPGVPLVKPYLLSIHNFSTIVM